jgi:hypothetical protein
MDISNIDFEYDGFFWMGSRDLPSWSGYRSFDSNPIELSSLMSIILICEDEDSTPDSKTFAPLINELLETEGALHQKVLDRILSEFGSETDLCGYDPKQDGLTNPVSSEELKSFIAPNVIYIHQRESESGAIYGFSFSCRWDEEHGIGILIENGNIVEYGNSSCAFEG